MTATEIRWVEDKWSRFAYVEHFTIIAYKEPHDPARPVSVFEDVDGDDCLIAHVETIDAALRIIADRGIA